MLKKRNINNFKPSIEDGKKLAFKRLKPFILSTIAILFLEIIAIVLLWVLAGKDQLKIMLIALAALHLLALATFLVVIDMGPANKMRKDNFHIKGMNVEQGHTFYYALKLSGLIRLIINSLWTTIMITIAVVLFFV